MYEIGKYKVIRFEYIAIERLFLITAQSPKTDRIIRIDIHNPTTEEITNAIDTYTNLKSKNLELMLACFGIY